MKEILNFINGEFVATTDWFDKMHDVPNTNWGIGGVSAKDLGR
ncbi:hypothetical protein [Pseudomonas veronii]|nr:hypothetical protein [Pseudomonas veronii]